MLFKRKNRKEQAKEEITNLKVQTRRKEKIKKENVDVKWVIKIIIIAFMISFCLSFISESTIPNLSLPFGILLILLFIFINILFDIIVPGGSNAAYIEPLSNVGEYFQNEILFNAGSRLTIIEDAKQIKIGKKLITVVKCLLN